MKTSEEDAFSLAEKLQHWMSRQDYFGESLLHSSVCCDHVGRMRFIKSIAKIISETELTPNKG